MEKTTMLKVLLLSLTLALAVRATAQYNLVPNGSFEDTVDCYTPGITGLRKALYWYNPNTSTPDVWDCDLQRNCGFGMSPEGGLNLSYQPSADGLRHAGGYYWYGPGSSNTREYMGVKLIAPMQGQPYVVSVRCARRRNFRYAVDHIGVWFGADSLWQNTTAWLTVAPQLKLRDPVQEYLIDGHEWHLLQDTLLATGGEQWMVIGNFDVANMVNGILVEPDGVNLPAYYFIDDVRVEPLLEQGFRESRLLGWVGVDGLHIRWPADFAAREVLVFDAIGNLVMKRNVTSAPATEFSAEMAVSAGIYVIRVLGAAGPLTVKVFKEEGF
jgi:hypothetical protein